MPFPGSVGEIPELTGRPFLSGAVGFIFVDLLCVTTLSSVPKRRLGDLFGFPPLSRRRIVLIRSFSHRPTISLLLLLLITSGVGAALSGCVSAKERYERVQNDRSEGRVVAAAFEMVKVLEDDESWPNGRRELNDLAREASKTLMGEAQTAVNRDRPIKALSSLDRIEDLEAACRDLDVSIGWPSGYDDLRATAVQDAYDLRMREGETAASEGRWAAAEDAYEDARQYAPGDNFLRTIDRRQADVRLAWAEEAMSAGQYRLAFDRAESALNLVPENTGIAQDVRALQDAAVAEGTRLTAFFPLWQTGEAAEALPRGFLREVNDVLNLNYWTEPPLFIAAVPPVPTRRLLRDMDLHRTVMSRLQASRAGRRLDADRVLVGDIVSFREEIDDLERKSVRVGWNPPEATNGRSATRGRPSADAEPTDTTYVIERYDRELHATVEIRVLDPFAKRTLAQHTMDVELDGSMERGVFDGDWQNLDLSGAETSLFRPEDVRERERELEIAFADAVANAVARESFDRILGTIE
jgi:tetratricopeptide (TPR) repeat protein